MSTPRSFGRRPDIPVKSEEIFPDYSPFLDYPVWLSIDGGKRQEERIAVEDMPPQRAASCLAKLVRWARQEPTGELSLVDDADVREEYVRTSVLGNALSARALNLTEEHMAGLYGEAGQGDTSDVRELIAEIAVSLGDDYPSWHLKERISLAVHVAQTMDSLYVMRKRRQP